MAGTNAQSFTPNTGINTGSQIANLFAISPKVYKQVIERVDTYGFVDAMGVMQNIETGGTGKTYQYAERGFKRTVITAAGSGVPLNSAGRATFTVSTAAAPYSIANDIPVVVGDVLRNTRTGRVMVVDAKSIASTTATLTVVPILFNGYNPQTDPYVGRMQGNYMGLTAQGNVSGAFYGTSVSNTALSNDISAGDLFVRVSNVYPEGSASSNDRGQIVPQIFSTYTQIIRSSSKETGTSKMMQLEWDGAMYSFDTLEKSVFEEHRADIALAARFGAVGQATLSSGTVNLMTSQEAYIQLHGSKLGYGDKITMSDIDAAIAIYDREGASRERMLECGRAAGLSLDNLFIDLTKNGGMNYDQTMIDLNFGAVKRGSTTFYYKTSEDFVSPIMGGVSGAYNDKIFDTPFKNIVNPKDGQVGKAMKLIFTADRQYKYLSTGMASNGTKTSADENKCEYLSECAFVMIGGNQSIIWQQY